MLKSTFQGLFKAEISQTWSFVLPIKQMVFDLAGWVWKGVFREQVTVTDNTALTAADSGKTFNIATDAKAFTLPLIAADNIGMNFTFRNIGADGAVALTISPAAEDGINGTIVNAAADSVASGVVDKDLVNTKATANKGDYVKLVAVAATTWYIEGGVGIWASEG